MEGDTPRPVSGGDVSSPFLRAFLSFGILGGRFWPLLLDFGIFFLTLDYNKPRLVAPGACYPAQAQLRWTRSCGPDAGQRRLHCEQKWAKMAKQLTRTHRLPFRLCPGVLQGTGSPPPPLKDRPFPTAFRSGGRPTADLGSQRGQKSKKSKMHFFMLWVDGGW